MATFGNETPVSSLVHVLRLSQELSASNTQLQWQKPYSSPNKSVNEFTRAIAEQRLVIENLLSTLLEDILGSESAARELRASPSSFNWNEPALESKLKAYLGEYNDVFFASLREIEHNLKMLHMLTQKLQGFNKQKYNRLFGPRSPWAFSNQRETADQLQAVTKSVTKLGAIVQNIVISRSQLEHLNIESVLERVGELETSPEDTDSLFSDVTDDEDEESFSIVIAVTLSPGDIPFLDVKRTVRRDALLDTGADRCCISEDIASELDAVLVPAEDVELWTANRQRIFHKGKMKLRVGWEETNGVGNRAKINFYVVQGFDVPLILSNYFVTKHRLFGFARNVSDSLVSRIAPILLEFRDSAKRAADAARLAVAATENQSLEDQERAARLEDLRRRMGLDDTVSRTSSMTSASQSLRNNDNASDIP